MKKFVEIVFIIIVPWIIILWVVFTFTRDRDRDYFSSKNIEVRRDSVPVDHSKFADLQKEFTSGPEVTEACLNCHNGRGMEFMKTEHWQWKKIDSIPGRGNINLGKINLLNDFCVGVNSNEKLCSLCHAGYGYGDKNFDFHNQNNIDCLICHDNTHKYKKSKPGKPNTGSGFPVPDVDLTDVAQHIGLPQRNNCGACHFTGGGGNNVKHGDLEKALNNCTRDVDVHMAADGKNFLCTDCHKTHNHQISGQLYTVSSSNKNSFGCEECHTDRPHISKLLNEHNEMVACQTCHIPIYAKVEPTKIYWDWSTAGKLKDGKPYTEWSEDKLHEYDTKHGTAIFGKDLQPEYIWFNGTADHFLITDKVKDTTKPLVLNQLFGSYQDYFNPVDSAHRSKIFPVKVMRGKQIYDPVNRTIIQPKLVGPKGSGAYWADYDWNASAKAGMDYLNLPYSGKYDFISTESFWPLNHEVSKSDKALKCVDCHRSDGGRLKNLTGFYLPGRDHNSLLDYFGVGFIILVLVGVSIHGTIRIISNKKNH